MMHPVKPRFFKDPPSFFHRPCFRLCLVLLVLIAFFAHTTILSARRSHLFPSLSQPGRTLLQAQYKDMAMRELMIPSSRASPEDMLNSAPSVRERHPMANPGFPARLFGSKYAAHVPDFIKSVQRWVVAKRYEPQIMHFLLGLVKDPIDRHYISQGKGDTDMGRPYKTCAVVGNSGLLLNQSNGDFIDSHEAVIRLNNARITGFRDHVGSKTTIAFVNSNILQMCARRIKCSCNTYSEAVPMVLYVCQLKHLMEVTYCSTLQQAPIIVTDPRFDALCTRIVKHYSLKDFVENTGKRPEEWSGAHDGPLFHYSSGMQAVTLALGICEEVDIFGFGKAPGVKHHYHTNQKAELDLHDYPAEYQFYHDLVNNRSSLIPFFAEARFEAPPVKIYL